MVVFGIGGNFVDLWNPVWLTISQNICGSGRIGWRNRLRIKTNTPKNMSMSEIKKALFERVLLFFDGSKKMGCFMVV